MAAVINPAVMSMETFGDSRTRDVYHRNGYQSVKAATAATKLQVGNTFYGVTASTGSAHTASSSFELAKITAVEDVADGFSASVQIAVNQGVDNLAGSTVATLAKTGVSFVADQLSATFATNFSSVINQGKARDTTTDATVQTFNAGATGPVRLLASANRLHVDATDFQVGGQLTVQKDKLNWVQEGGTAGYKLSAANDTYLYTHGATGALSSGVRNFNLDAYNVDNALMGSGGFSFKSFDNAGAAVEVLKMEAGADPTAGQNVSFLNSNLGVGVAGSSAYKLNVAGASNLNGNTSVTGSLAVTGDLTVSGTLTTVNSTEVSVRDRNITLASGATSVAQLDTGGIQLGTDPAYQVNFQYNDAVAYKAWQSNVNIDVAAGKDFTIAGGATNPNGMTLDSSHLTFYDPTTALKIGANDVLLSKTGLSFADPLATINFGGTLLGKDGFAATGPSAVVKLGHWKLNVIDYGANGGETFTFSFDPVGNGLASDYVTKFSISP